MKTSNLSADNVKKYLNVIAKVKVNAKVDKVDTLARDTVK